MTDEEKNVITWTVLGEAANQGAQGMKAVALVIANRAASGRFPSNPATVALQHNATGIYQFSTWNSLLNGGNAPRARYPAGSAAFNKAKAIVEEVFGPTPPVDITQGAMFYYNPATVAQPYWWTSEAPKGGKKIGAHLFAIRQDEIPPQPRPASERPIVIAPEPATPSPLTQAMRGQIFDPQTKKVYHMPAISDLVRAAGRVASESGSESSGAKLDNDVYKTVQRVSSSSDGWDPIDSAPTWDDLRASFGAVQKSYTTSIQPVSASDKVRAARVAPKAEPPSKMTPNGFGATWEGVLQFANPPEAGPEGPDKDQGRLAPGEAGLPALYGAIDAAPIPAVMSAALAAQRQIIAPIPAVMSAAVAAGRNGGGDGGGSTTTPATPAPPSPTTPSLPTLYHSGDYVYQSNGQGGYTKVGKLIPELRPGHSGGGGSSGTPSFDSGGGHTYNSETGSWERSTN